MHNQVVVVPRFLLQMSHGCATFFPVASILWHLILNVHAFLYIFFARSSGMPSQECLWKTSQIQTQTRPWYDFFTHKCWWKNLQNHVISTYFETKMFDSFIWIRACRYSWRKILVEKVLVFWAGKSFFILLMTKIVIERKAWGTSLQSPNFDFFEVSSTLTKSVQWGKEWECSPRYIKSQEKFYSLLMFISCPQN